jgi:DNA-binding MarR family transcriptional regulator
MTTPEGMEPMADVGEGRDLVDGMTDAWRREMPGFDVDQFQLVKRAARLGLMLEDALSAHLTPRRLTKADYGVLSALMAAGAPYELRPGDLTARVLLTSGGVSNVLNRLTKKGLVSRERDAGDGRSSRVRLTLDGVEVTAAVTREWMDVQDDFLRSVPGTSTAVAAGALREILVALGDHEPPPLPRA